MQSQPQFITLTPVLKRLLSLHRTIIQRKEQEIEPKLQLLSDYITEALMSVKLQENIWLSASRLVIQEIRLLLVEDARCLLFTIDFQQFIHDVFENVLLTSVSNIEVKGDTTNWLILSLPLPLKLSGFRDCNLDNNYNYSIDFEIDEYKQILQVPI
jgi:hypothetical protein